MKQSCGFTKLAPSVVTITTMMISFWLPGVAMRTIPPGTAYIIWTGIGAAGAFVIGALFLAELLSALRIVAAALIVSGLVLMKVSG